LFVDDNVELKQWIFLIENSNEILDASEMYVVGGVEFIVVDFFLYVIDELARKTVFVIVKDEYGFIGEDGVVVGGFEEADDVLLNAHPAA
jgi:hypothetical protein